MQEFVKEVDVMSKLHHPHIVLFMGATLTPVRCIVTELCAKGALLLLLLLS